MNVSSVCVCAACACSAHRDQKREVDTLELELQMVVNLHVGSVTRTWIFLQQQQVLLTVIPLSSLHSDLLCYPPQGNIKSERGPSNCNSFFLNLSGH